jgi:AsmA protein
MPVLRRTLYIALAIGALLVGAALALPLFVSGETARNQIVNQVAAQTGMALRLDGKVSVSAFPQIAVTARSVGLAPSPGEAEILAAREVRFSLQLLPLLRGRVELSGLTLVKPEFTIEAGGGAEAASDGEASDLPVSSAQLERLRINRLGIEEGTLIVKGSPDDPPTVIEAINLTTGLKGANAPATVNASFRFKAVDHRLNVTLANLAELIDKGGTGAKLDFETGTVNVSADGRLWRIQGGSFDGRITAKIDAFDPVLESYGLAPVGVASLDNAALGAELIADTSGFRLSGIDGQIGDMTLAGDLSIIVGGEKPELGAVLSIDRIDLAGMATAGEGRSGAAGDEDFDIDLSPLKLIEADARLDVGQISNGPVELNDLSAVIGVHDGALDVSLLQAKGLGGGASGSVRLRPDEAQTAQVSGLVKLDRIDLEQAARLAEVSVPATGAISTDLKFAAAGATMNAMRQSLAFGGSAGLRDGTVTGLGLADAFGNDPAADRLEAVAVDASFAGLDGPVDINGSLQWRGLPITVAAKLDAGALAAGKPAAVNVAAKSSLASVGYAGNVSVANPGVDGTVSLQTPSLTKLAQWAGQPLAVEQGLQAFAIKGRLSVAGDRIAFADAEISLDGSSGSGAVEANLSGAIPQITGRLAMQRIDVTPYLVGGSRASAAPAGSGWSDAPIDFSGLGAINAKLQLSADELVWDTLKTGRTELDLGLNESVLTADLTRLALYGGQGQGQLKLQAKSGVPTVAADFNLSGLSLLPFLTDAASFSRIEGSGALRFSATASGRSERQLTQTLAGSGSIDFRDGTIRGINIPKMVRGLTGGILQGWQQTQNAKTDFSSLTASYTIDKGRLETSDLQLVGPLVRISGAGKANIPEKTLAFRIDPKVVADLQGQGGEADLAGLGVPVIIEGAWSNPRIYPDIQSILQDPQAALQRLQQTGGALFQAKEALPKDAGDAAGALIKGLLGGGQQTGTAASPPPDSGVTATSPQASTEETVAESPDGIGQLIEQSPSEPAGPETGQTLQPSEPAADLLKRLLGQ